MHPASNLTLDKVTIAGFRGYRDSKTIGFNGKSAVLLGPNMSGKSSTLGAIEWCLFGDFYSLPGDRTRTRDELVNDHSPSASVKVELARDGNRFVIERVKQMGESKSKLRVTLEDGSVVLSHEAPNRIFQVLGLSFEDFVRSVYLHQENMRDILTEDRKIRSEAMDRLFGLENLRNISDGLKSSIVKDAYLALTNQRDEVVNHITARVSEADRNLQGAIAVAAGFGVPKRSLTLAHAKGLVAEAGRILKDAAEGTDITMPAQVSIFERSDIDAAAGSIDSTVALIRKRLPEDRRVKEINTVIADLESAHGEFNKARTVLAQAERDSRSFIEENGGAKELEQRITAQESKIEKLKADRSQMDTKGQLIQAAIKFLGEMTDIVRCPICGRSAKQQDIVRHLEKEAKMAVTSELKEIERTITKAEAEMKATERLLKESERLEEEVKDSRRELEKKVAELARLLKKTLSLENVESEVKNEILRLRTEKKKFEGPINLRETKFAEIAAFVKQAEAIADVLKKQERLNELSSIHERKELKKIESVIKELARLERCVQLMGDATRKLQTELAERLVMKSLPAIKEFYANLVAHPYYNSLQIEVQPDTRGGVTKNLYVVKGIAEDATETVASLKFSTGHMNCVGLSVFLALAREGAYTHKLGFLILDDPSQNLDDNHKLTLAKTLAKMQNNSQLIIATEDGYFQQQLKDALRKDDTVLVEFGPWDVDGPNMRVTG